MKDILQALKLGNSVAEFDDSLEKYFVENEAFHALVRGDIDIVAGDKGTGKTALYRIVQKRHRELEAIANIEILPGFNPSGSSVFQKLVQGEALTEGLYVSVWKAYLLSLAGNWALDIVGENGSESFKQLEKMLEQSGLRTKDQKPDTIFGKITNYFFRKPSSTEYSISVTETGLPTFGRKASYTGIESKVDQPKEISHEEALSLLDRCLNELGIILWIALDRLDEAFDGFPNIEIPALRALLRTYLDLQAFGCFKLKLFLRRDLFRRIIGSGFVNLTHVNARMGEIRWDERDLLNLLSRRIRDNPHVIQRLDAAALTDEQLFYRIFPAKVDQATRKPTSLAWIMGRIRDGNGVQPPRNLLDLVMFAREEQLRMESRSSRDFDPKNPLIEADALKKALSRLSERRVIDTLFAEASPDTTALIEKFRSGKAEHNRESLAKLLGLDGDALQRSIELLKQVGFLEELPSSWKVPTLYRGGLQIRMGKAFDESDHDEADD